MHQHSKITKYLINVQDVRLHNTEHQMIYKLHCSINKYHHHQLQLGLLTGPKNLGSRVFIPETRTDNSQNESRNSGARYWFTYLLPRLRNVNKCGRAIGQCCATETQLLQILLFQRHENTFIITTEHEYNFIQQRYRLLMRACAGYR